MNKIKHWLVKLDTLQVRERVIVILALLALLYLLLTSVFVTPFLKSHQQLKSTINGSTLKKQELQQEQQTLLTQLSADPNKTLQIEIDELNTSVAELDQKLQDLSLGMVPADALVQILEDVLRQTEQVTLVRLAVAPARELQLTTIDSATEIANTGVFKHMVSVTVQGKYFDIQKYLQKLEALPWSFYWQDLQYDVDGYPKATAVLRVYTLTTEEGLIGV